MLCGRPAHCLVYELESWQYLSCKDCGLVWLHPRPSSTELLKSYDTYLSVHENEIESWRKMIKPVVDTAANLINDLKKTEGKRLLDIGCGYGFFLHEMTQRGWHVEGIEVSSTGREYARKNLGLAIHSKLLENINFPDASFDVVTLFYVIEHVHDPGKILREVHRILKPDGMVLLRWPHSTPIIKIMGPLAKRFDIYHTPFHLFDFNPGAMELLLEKSGFSDNQHVIGGFTLPQKRLYRWSSILFGGLAEILRCISMGRYLLAGVSKTSIGYKKLDRLP